ncbi:MAG: hypothetical protein QNK37_05655 [Acidobacteriota bacterium]|nr:hypothetical protein [Acidobacteriota bacterium]
MAPGFLSRPARMSLDDTLDCAYKTEFQTERRETMTVKALLLRLPYFTLALPPRKLLNRFLGEGRARGFQWQPFRLTEKAYEKFLREGRDDRVLETTEPPEDIEDLEHWLVWLMEERHGIPAGRHRRLREVVHRLEEAVARVTREGDEERRIELHLQLIDAKTMLKMYIGHHLEKNLGK